MHCMRHWPLYREMFYPSVSSFCFNLLRVVTLSVIYTFILVYLFQSDVA